LGPARGAGGAAVPGVVAAGLPLLSGGRGGLGVFAGPSVGYLVGFPIAAFVTGWLMERTTLPVGFAAGAAAVIGGIGVLYVFGITGLSIMLDKTLAEAAFLGMAFLPGDILKAVLAGLVTQSLARMRPASLLSRA
jgi:biotin transport system substrate-specific component